LQGRLTQADLDYYDDMLTNLIDPLVASGHVQWATIDEMHSVFEAWEIVNCPAAP